MQWNQLKGSQKKPRLINGFGSRHDQLDSWTTWDDHMTDRESWEHGTLETWDVMLCSAVRDRGIPGFVGGTTFVVVVFSLFGDIGRVSLVCFRDISRVGGIIMAFNELLELLGDVCLQ